MVTFIPGLTVGSPAQTLVQLSLDVGRTNFEVQFSSTQNAMIDTLNERVTAFQGSDFGESKTALLRIEAAGLRRDLEEARDTKAVVSSNRLTVEDLFDQLTELRDLADSSTVTEFEAKRDEVLDTLDKLRTTATSPLTAPDGLSGAKADGLAAIEGIVTNGFAGAADIQSAQDAIDGVTADLESSHTILEINQELLADTITSKDRVLGDTELTIDAIKSDELQGDVDRIQALEEETANVLSNISLSFEASQILTSFVAENTVLPREIEPGSVLNLFA